MNENSKRYEEILNLINNSEKDTNRQTLGLEALELSNELLKENPINLTVLIDRMNLNYRIFNNSASIIEDANYIITNESFGTNRIIGYDWLSWVYDEILGMPDKAEEVIQEALIEIQNLFTDNKEKDKKEGTFLNQLATIKYQNDQFDEALHIWYLSFQKNPDIDQRNGKVGMLYLDNEMWNEASEFLTLHYYWSYDLNDGHRLKYAKKLYELFQSKKIEDQPQLLGIMFNAIRNEPGAFEMKGNLYFYDNFFSDLLQYAEKYPQNTLLWNAVANTYFYDLKNYEKAYDAFVQLLKTDESIRFNSVKNVFKSAKKSKQDFFNLPFHIDKVDGISAYNNLTDLIQIDDKTHKKKKRLQILELALKYGEQGYNFYKENFTQSNKKNNANDAHMFAMLCNNYAIVIERWALLNYKKDPKEKEKEKLLIKVADIHMEGYGFSPFYENLSGASSTYFQAGKYKLSIQCSLQLLNSFSNNMDVFDFQNEYWQMTYACVKTDDLTNAEKYYFIAKDFFGKYGKDNEKATYKFIYTGKLFYRLAVEDKKEYKKYIPEMEWYLNQKIAVEQQPEEHGLVSYFLGLCYENTANNQKAITAFNEAINYMQKVENWKYYEDKTEEAKNHLKKFGVSLKNEKKSLKKRLKKILFFPIGLFVVIGLLIMTALTDDKKKPKK